MNIIQAEKRDPAAKAKQLRRMGIVPCVVSSAEWTESLSLQIDQNTARQLKRTKRDGSKVDLQVDGTLYHTLIKDLAYSVLNDSVVHITFQVLDAGKKVNSVADIVLKNKDTVPGILEQLLMKVPHAAIPAELLDVVAIDLTGLAVGTTITLRDIPAFQSNKIELQVDPDSIVLRIRDKKRADAQRSSAAAETAL